MDRTRLPTRTEGAQVPASEGQSVRISPCYAGISLEDDSLGLWVIPSADGRLAFKIVGPLGCPGSRPAGDLLQTDARRDFAVSAVRLQDNRLICMEPSCPGALLEEGFELTVSTPMATALAAWLPRLVEVAELAAPIARAIQSHLAPGSTLEGLDVCDEVVAAILLDGKSVDLALASVALHHWTLGKAEWQAAFELKPIHQLLEQVEQQRGSLRRRLSRIPPG